MPGPGGCATGSPIKFPNGDLRYDVIDLNKWLDKLKDNGEDSEEIIKRLAGS
jgi:hypothetical protein